MIIALPEGCKTFAYADDLVLVVGAMNKEEMIYFYAANSSLRSVSKWMMKNHQSLGTVKDRGRNCKRRKKQREIFFNLDGVNAAPSRRQ